MAGKLKGHFDELYVVWYFNITTKFFIFLSSNSGQSQLDFGIQFILIGACVVNYHMNCVPSRARPAGHNMW